jgi:hypothetical protein
MMKWRYDLYFSPVGSHYKKFTFQIHKTGQNEKTRLNGGSFLYGSLSMSGSQILL